jgi:hypothetical protein
MQGVIPRNLWCSIRGLGFIWTKTNVKAATLFLHRFQSSFWTEASFATIARCQSLSFGIMAAIASSNVLIGMETPRSGVEKAAEVSRSFQRLFRGKFVLRILVSPLLGATNFSHFLQPQLGPHERLSRCRQARSHFRSKGVTVPPSPCTMV